MGRQGPRRQALCTIAATGHAGLSASAFYPAFMTKYFRVLAAKDAVDRWFLRAPVNSFGEEVDPRIFTESLACDVTDPLTLPVRRSGKVVDFNFADFDMPVLSAAAIDQLQSIAGVHLQRVPVAIPGITARFELLNVLDSVDCIDEKSSVYTKWTPADGRPEKVGEYRMFVNLRVDRQRAEGHHLFRIDGWKVALVISELVKQTLEGLNVSGVEYQCIS